VHFLVCNQTIIHKLNQSTCESSITTKKCNWWKPPSSFAGDFWKKKNPTSLSLYLSNFSWVITVKSGMFKLIQIFTLCEL